MEITSSYKVEIKSCLDLRAVQDTVLIYRKALDFIIDVCNKEWDNISACGDKNKKNNYVEKLIHKTEKNDAPAYPFDAEKSPFYKFPSYLRRAIVSYAIGCVSTYKKAHKKWNTKLDKEGNHIGKEPTLQYDRNVMPTFYKGNMYMETEPRDFKRTQGYKDRKIYTRWLKLYKDKDWVWVAVQLKKTDIDYIIKYWSACEKQNVPTLEKHHKKYFLRFSFTEKVDLNETPVMEQKICSIDIGHNTDAVCSIMKSDGTVLKRKFVDFPSEKDLIHRLLNRINKKQSNKQRVTGLWQYTKFLNDEHAKDIARCVVDFAAKNHVNVIVMERLNFKGKKYGDKAQILSMWNYGKIQAYIEHRAHRNGIRISRICARNTSQLAFDGSSKLVRDKHNMALATFSTGKQYNCDLNASYNIGARYFIREILKSLPETTGCSLKAKVPMMNRRTSCTLSTLWQVNDVLSIITSAI